MPRAPRVVVANAVYHARSRGSNRERLFFDDSDYEEFLLQLGLVANRYAWRIYAYCLMPNHNHFLIRVPECGLSEGMRDLNGGFSRRTSAKYGRIAHLFKNRFGDRVVEDDNDFAHVARYVVLNPVAAGICDHPRRWRWSSYRATAGLDGGPSWLAVDELLEHFRRFAPTQPRVGYIRFVEKSLPPVSDTVSGT
jgi:REP element-mobilizing transposase RayT